MNQWFITSSTMPVSSMIEDSPYRDIRDDLRARITGFEKMASEEQARFAAQQEKALAAHKQQMDAFKAAIIGYQRMLDLEETLARIAAEDTVGPRRDSVTIPVPTPKMPLADFFEAELRAKGPMSKDELRQAAQAAGYFPGGDGGGRATHATLVNITRNQRITPTSDGKFVARTLEDALL